MTNYLKDGRLKLSNNRAERNIKSFIIDRKNFLFANTPRGAKGSAGVFSIIQTALDENGKIYTVEGNTSDSCAERQYAVGHYEILGFGIPAY